MLGHRHRPGTCEVDQSAEAVFRVLCRQGLHTIPVLREVSFGQYGRIYTMARSQVSYLDSYSEAFAEIDLYGVMRAANAVETATRRYPHHRAGKLDLNTRLLLTTSAVTELPSLSDTIGTNAGTESLVRAGSRNAAALPAFLA